MNNDLIRMLSDQAREYADTFDDVGTPIWLFQYNRFFTEFIVRECMNAIYDIDDLGGYHFKAANAVKQHFGVEE